jgi:hypothetical protein
MENTPVFIEFNYDVIPAAIIQKCKQHLSNYYEIDETSEERTKNLIYLSWLYANGFILRFDGGIEFPDHRYEYEDPDGEGHILNNIRMQYDLNEIFPFLRLTNKV